MKLKEFGLDLRDALAEERKHFRWATRCVCSLYERMFPGLVVPRTWKVLVECTAQMRQAAPIDQLGVLCHQVAFNKDKFFALGAQGRKEMALETLHSGVLGVARSQGWSPAPFEAAQAAVIERKFVNEWTWPKPRPSPTKRWRAQLTCNHDSDAFRAWLVIRDKTGDAAAKHLAIVEEPSEFIFVPKLGSLTWSSDESVALCDNVGDEIVSLAYDGGTRTWVASRPPLDDALSS